MVVEDLGGARWGGVRFRHEISSLADVILGPCRDRQEFRYASDFVPVRPARPRWNREGEREPIEKGDPKNRMVEKSQGERACAWGPMLMLASERSRQFRVGLENSRSGGTRSVGRGPVETQRPEGTQCPARVEPAEPCRALPQS